MLHINFYKILQEASRFVNAVHIFPAIWIKRCFPRIVAKDMSYSISALFIEIMPETPVLLSLSFRFLQACKSVWLTGKYSINPNFHLSTLTCLCAASISTTGTFTTNSPKFKSRRKYGGRLRKRSFTSSVIGPKAVAGIAIL